MLIIPNQSPLRPSEGEIVKNQTTHRLISQADEIDYFIFGFRYALGRSSMATHTVQQSIKKSWHLLSDQHKDLIKREINQHKETWGKIGMEIDEKGWASILDL